MALSRAGRELVLWNRRVRAVPPVAYAISCALVGIGIGIRGLLGEALQGVPFITIFPAVIIATWLGGLGPGVLAMVLGGVGAWFYLLPAADPSVVDTHQRVASLVVYALVAGFDCLLVDWLIKAPSGTRRWRGGTSS